MNIVPNDALTPEMAKRVVTINQLYDMYNSSKLATYNKLISFGAYLLETRNLVVEAGYRWRPWQEKNLAGVSLAVQAHAMRVAGGGQNGTSGNIKSVVGTPAQQRAIYDRMVAKNSALHKSHKLAVAATGGFTEETKSVILGWSRKDRLALYDWLSGVISRRKEAA